VPTFEHRARGQASRPPLPTGNTQTEHKDIETMIAATCDPFTEFLQTQLGLQDHEVPVPGEWANVGNTTGALALRLGLLTVEQIDHILESQETNAHGKFFGEIAVELGFVEQVQIERLLDIQLLNRRLELGEQLVLSGRTDMQSLLGNLQEFQLQGQQ
jgi:hypothetical protein